MVRISGLFHLPINGGKMLGSQPTDPNLTFDLPALPVRDIQVPPNLAISPRRTTENHDTWRLRNGAWGSNATNESKRWSLNHLVSLITATNGWLEVAWLLLGACRPAPCCDYIWLHPFQLQINISYKFGWSCSVAVSEIRDCRCGTKIFK